MALTREVPPMDPVSPDPVSVPIILDRESLRALGRPRPVDLAAGGRVFVRAFTLRDMLAADFAQGEAAERDPTFFVEVVLRAACNADGSRMFDPSDPEDRDTVEGLPAAVAQEIGLAAIKASGLDGDRLASLGKV
jgi:hypothetical protein